MIRALLAGIAVCVGSATQAAQVGSCDSWIAHAQNVFWADPTRSFANGEIRLVALDTEGEPVCCSTRLMVLYVLPDEPFYSCALVTQDGDLGWAGMALSQAEASYDPEIGLTVDVPVGLYTGAGTDIGVVSVTINRATGSVTAW